MTSLLEVPDSVNIPAADNKLGLLFVLQPDFVFPSKPLYHLTDIVDIHNGGTVNSDEDKFVQFLFQFGKRQLCDVLVLDGMEKRVLVFCLEVV